jgi:hypothetical protein
MSKDKWQRIANQNQNEKRKGAPTYSNVRLSDQAEKEWLDDVIKNYGGTKKDSLIAAYKALEKELSN